MTEIITTTIRGKDITLHWQPEEGDIPGLIEKGVIPIEMSEGTKSYVDGLCLDHHNEYSDKPSACITAMQYWNVAGDIPAVKLMANHVDLDCVATGVVLMGLLPSDLLERLTPEVGLLDTDPMNPKAKELAFGNEIAAWKAAMMGKKDTGWSWLYGVQLLLDIFEHPETWEPKIVTLAQREAERVKMAEEDYAAAKISKSGCVILIAPSRVPGFDVQFQRQESAPIEALEGWKHHCILAYLPQAGNVTVSCPNTAVAEAAFGPGGLKNVFPKLPEVNGKTWGGRESVGGSPRGETVPEDALEDILAAVDGMVKAGARKGEDYVD